MPELKPAPKTKDPLLAIVLERRRMTRRQAAVGVAGTILLHLLGWLMIPHDLFQAEPSEPIDKYSEFSIELAEPEEPDLSYTQTNPDAPENEPDETDRFGARDQQAANPDLPEELDPDGRPALESEDTIETDQFLSGSLEEPVFAPPPSPEEQPEEPVEPQDPGQPQPLLQAVDASEATLKEEIPIAGSRDELEEDEEGIADVNQETQDREATNLTELVEGEQEEGEETREAQPEQMPRAGQPVSVPNYADNLPAPRPRPQLPRVAPGPTRNSLAGVRRQGELQVDAKGSEFGEYMERLIETVSIKWDDLATKSSHIERNSVVKVRFVLTKEGYVSDIEILEGTTSRAIGIYMCREAIQQGVPYGPWPQGLVDMFGDDEDIHFNFYYR